MDGQPVPQPCQKPWRPKQLDDGGWNHQRRRSCASSTAAHNIGRNKTGLVGFLSCTRFVARITHTCNRTKDIFCSRHQVGRLASPRADDVVQRAQLTAKGNAPDYIQGQRAAGAPHVQAGCSATMPQETLSQLQSRSVHDWYTAGQAVCSMCCWIFGACVYEGCRLTRTFECGRVAALPHVRCSTVGCEQRAAPCRWRPMPLEATVLQG